MILKSGTRLRGSKEGLAIFLGSGYFLVASVWSSKETLWPLGFERLRRPTKLKFCRQLPWYNSGPQNFIQLNRINQWFSNFLARGTLKETKNFSRHTQANFDKKNCDISSCRKKFAAPFKFLMAPQGAAAHSLKTTGINGTTLI